MNKLQIKIVKKYFYLLVAPTEVGVGTKLSFFERI